MPPFFNMDSIVESFYFWKKLMNSNSNPDDFWMLFNKYQLFLGLGRDYETMKDYLDEENNG